MIKRLTIILSAVVLCCSAAMASETLPADTNGDGKVDKADATLIYSYIFGTADESVTPADVDVNGDGKVNTADVVEVYNYINKMIGNIDVNVDDWVNSDGGDLETE